MRNNSHPFLNTTLGRFGFLFADLFAVLAMLFLLANTVGNVTFPPPPTPTPTITPTVAPLNCGLQHTAGFDNRTNAFPVSPTLANPNNAGYNAAVASFQAEVQQAFQSYYHHGNIAGYVLIWGEALMPGDGDSLASGAQVALQNLGAQNFVFVHSDYQTVWDGKDYQPAKGDAVALEVFFYTTATNGKSCSN